MAIGYQEFPSLQTQIEQMQLTSTQNNNQANSASSLIELSTLQQQLLGDQGLLATGGAPSAIPPDGSSQNPLEINQRPWVTPPDGSVPFDFQSGIVLPNPPAAGFTVVLTMQVPQGLDGVINAYNFNFTGGGFDPFSGDIIWQMARGTQGNVLQPIRNFDAILNDRGTILTPRPVSPIRIYSLQIIQILVSHPSNVGLSGNVVAGLSGYFYPNKG